ncbi:hypothetical protein KTF54_09945, partial [Bifidobacterium longum]|nr:hypothetical protein [Bifidobacterium longum]MBU9087438.1 hypothetical protein [Bifidobacterium longum]
CFVWRQKIVHRTRAMSLSRALNQFAQNLGRYPAELSRECLDSARRTLPVLQNRRFADPQLCD